MTRKNVELHGIFCMRVAAMTERQAIRQTPLRADEDNLRKLIRSWRHVASGRALPAIAHQWERYCDIKFKFVTAGTPEIRISFYADSGSWSAVGRDALNQQYFPTHQPTMN